MLVDNHLLSIYVSIFDMIVAPNAELFKSIVTY